MYNEADMLANRSRMKKEVLRTLACVLPFLIAAVAALVLRAEIVCAVACVALGALLIFLWDMKLAPLMRYGRFLKEIHSGLSRRTAGTVVRIGRDEVYQDGVYFHELIINIYEDLDEEGERRFLVDCAKAIAPELMGRDVVVTSHGSFALNVELMAA